MYIGLLSDTHGLFDGPLKEFLQPVDEIWHAGDFGTVEVADAIAAFKPLKGVYGNCDGQELRFENPLYQSFTCEGMKVLMTHVGGYPGRYEKRAAELIKRFRPDLFICGHSHILRVMGDKSKDLMVMNPGAAGVYGFHLVRTALRFRIEDGQIKDMEVLELPKKKGNVL